MSRPRKPNPGEWCVEYGAKNQESLGRWNGNKALFRPSGYLVNGGLGTPLGTGMGRKCVGGGGGRPDPLLYLTPGPFPAFRNNTIDKDSLSVKGSR